MGSTKLFILAIAGLATVASGDVIAFEDYREPRGVVDSVEAIYVAHAGASVVAESPFQADHSGGLAVGPIAHPAFEADEPKTTQPDDEAPLFAPRRHDLWTGVLVRTTAMVF